LADILSSLKSEERLLCFKNIDEEKAADMVGGLFIAVVLAFPNGLAGIWSDYVAPQIARLFTSGKSKPGNGWTDKSVADGAPAE